MNERQAFALRNPFGGADDIGVALGMLAPYTTVRRHGRGFLLRSILAVDR